jgi:hypothetical protein
MWVGLACFRMLAFWWYYQQLSPANNAWTKTCNARLWWCNKLIRPSLPFSFVLQWGVSTRLHCSEIWIVTWCNVLLFALLLWSPRCTGWLKSLDCLNVCWYPFCLLFMCQSCQLAVSVQVTFAFSMPSGSYRPDGRGCYSKFEPRTCVVGGATHTTHQK